MDRLRDGHSAGGGRSRRGWRRRRGAGHHDHRSVSQGLRGGSRHRHGDVPGGRHGQGLGHDRAAHGHHARLPHHRCRGAIPARSIARSPMRSRYTFNAITVDGEPSTNDCVFALANGASGVNIREDLYDDLVHGFRAVAHELALAIVRGGEGATKLVVDHGQRRGVGGRRLDGRARHRQLAAGEDRHPRRRPELGPPGGRRRPIGRRVRRWRARWCHRLSGAVRATAGPTTSGAPGRGLPAERQTRRSR